MKKNVLLSVLSILILLSSCKSESHYHDGEYHADIDVFGLQFAKIDYEINGNEIIINNSVTGISKLQCQQYEDRIEYVEPNGTKQVLPVLENGDIKFNEQIILKKTN